MRLFGALILTAMLLCVTSTSYAGEVCEFNDLGDTYDMYVYGEPFYCSWNGGGCDWLPAVHGFGFCVRHATTLEWSYNNSNCARTDGPDDSDDYVTIITREDGQTLVTAPDEAYDCFEGSAQRGDYRIYPWNLFWDGYMVIYGGNYDDYLYGAAGDDEIYGGDGDDHIYGLRGADILDGEGHTNVVYAGASCACTDTDGAEDITVTSGANAEGGTGCGCGDGDEMTCEDGPSTGGGCMLFGQYGGDDITGSADDDWISGHYGEDTLRGMAGDDYITGGPQGDELCGGNCSAIAPSLCTSMAPWTDGDDRLYGGDGIDLLVGCVGADDLYGNDDGDYLYGGDYNNAASSLDLEDGGDDQYNDACSCYIGGPCTAVDCEVDL